MKSALRLNKIKSFVDWRYVLIPILSSIFIWNINLPRAIKLSVTILNAVILAIIFMDYDKYPRYTYYINFLLEEIPNILQILTFSGFLAIIFAHYPDTSWPLILSALFMLNTIYLLKKGLLYISTKHLEDRYDSSFIMAFNIFSVTFTAICTIIFYFALKSLYPPV